MRLRIHSLSGNNARHPVTAYREVCLPFGAKLGNVFTVRSSIGLSPAGRSLNIYAKATCFRHRFSLLYYLCDVVYSKQ